VSRQRHCHIRQTISATAEASDFKFGTLLGFAKAHHKVTPRGKSVRGPGLGKLPNILGFPYNISATAEANDFNFGTQYGFAKPIIKSHREKKWWLPWAREAP